LNDVKKKDSRQPVPANRFTPALLNLSSLMADRQRSLLARCGVDSLLELFRETAGINPGQRHVSTPLSEDQQLALPRK